MKEIEEAFLKRQRSRHSNVKYYSFIIVTLKDAKTMLPLNVCWMSCQSGQCVPLQHKIWVAKVSRHWS